MSYVDWILMKDEVVVAKVSFHYRVSLFNKVHIE
jgi:hypothetical protein